MSRTAPGAWRARAERMNPSVIREILKLTERPGHHLARRRPAVARHLSGRGDARGDRARAARHAARGAAVRGERRLRAAARMGRRARCAAQGLRVDASQVLITTGSQQGLDLVGKVLIDAGSPVAVESPTYLGALQAFAPYEPEFVGDRLRRRRAAARGAGRARPRRALPLPAAELPEPERPLRSARRGAPRSSHARAAARPADRRGQPVRRPLVRRAAAAAARLALARGHDLPRLVLEGARAGPAPRLRRSRRRGAMPEAAAGQAGRRPAHAGLQPARRARGDHATASCASTCRRSARATRRSATRCRRRSTRTCRAGCRWKVPGGGMFFWVELPEGVDADGAAAAAVERGVAFVPGAPFFAGEPTHEHAAPVVRDGRARARSSAASRALARRRWRTMRVSDGASPSPRSTSSPSAPLRGNPLAVVHDADGARRRADAGVRALDQPERDDLPARAHRPGGRLPRPHLHARRRAAVRRPSDARQLPRLARARRRAAARRRGRAAVRRRPGAHPARRRAARVRGAAAARSGRSSRALLAAGAARRSASTASARRRCAVARQRPALARPAAARRRGACSRSSPTTRRCAASPRSASSAPHPAGGECAFEVRGVRRRRSASPRTRSPAA